MKKFVFIFLAFVFAINIYAADFTIASYNVGGLSDHYDFLRAACMQKIMNERYVAEPEIMAQVERIQQVALKVLFDEANEEWDGELLQKTIQPKEYWQNKADAIITSYKIRPIVIGDEEIIKHLQNHFFNLVKEGLPFEELVEKGRSIMSKTIFHNYVKTDIIALQEGTYLHPSHFPGKYEVLTTGTGSSTNGIAYNKERFQLLEKIGDIMGKAFALSLLDKTTGKTVLVASAHLTGCDPFQKHIDPISGIADSDKGDLELQTIINLFDTFHADVKIIAMDANVTATHPRLRLLKDNGYFLDAKNFIEPTCTYPYSVVNTRIDWIAIKSESATITNFPILSVGLNSIESNMSDHKPIGARIGY